MPDDPRSVGAPPVRSCLNLRRAVFCSFSALLFLTLILFAFSLATKSRVPRRAAGIYGGLFEKIQRHPQATAAICLTGVAATWGAIGLLAAAEGRRSVRASKD